MTTRKPSITRALATALKAHPPEPRGAAIAALARRLAADVDAAEAPDEVAKLSARLLPALVELGMGRSVASTVTKGGVADEPRAVLDEIRERRRARSDRAAPVDTAAG